MRNKPTVLIAMTAMAIGAQAQVVFNNVGGADLISYIWTVTDLNNDPNPVVSTGNGTAVGTLTGAGDFLGFESFSLTASGRSGWNTEDAQAATNAFGAYLSGLSVDGVGAMADGDFGVDSPSNAAAPVEHALDGTDELLVLTADTSGLAAGSALSFKGVLFEIYDDPSRTDFLIYDASADEVVEAQWNANYNSSGLISGSWALDDGDKVLIATASDNASTKWRIAEFTVDVAAGAADTASPIPNPATWASVPTNISPVAITMTATTGSDESGVEYFFDETSGNTGGTDSGWQGDPSYIDSGLDSLTQYSYTVTMRDLAGNTGTVSSVATATTPAADTTAPTPNPATWASAPTTMGPFAVSMTATMGSDDSGVEYFFDETSGNTGGTDSGWQSGSSYTDSGQSPETQYSYTVTMRDTAGNTGTVSSVESVTTPVVTGRTNGPPNVVIIYADDLGYADIGHNATNPLVYTPNIDRICNEGIYLNNYMTHHVCSPSRSGLLTGRHHTEVGFGAQTGGTLDNSIPNIAKDFQAAGYATGAFGKWHNSTPPETDDGNWEQVSNLSGIILGDGKLQLVGSDAENFGEGVNAYGFDEWSGFYGGGHSYHTRIDAREFDWWINSTWSPEVDGYNTYIIRDSALKFIDDHAEEPFFLYIPNECVHGPYELLNTDLEEMCNIVDDVNSNLAWGIVKELESPSTGRKVKDVLQLFCNSGDPYDPKEGYEREFDKAVMDQIHPGFDNLIYYTMIYAMDKSTRDILDRLDAYGLTTNTIVVFASDNGGTTSGENYPFRGFKHQLYEGGVHVAAAVWWPEHLDANQAPYTPADNVYTNLTQYFDWYPTLINMAGQTVMATELDGINLYPHLLARTDARPDEYIDSFYDVDDQHAAIRTQRWKLHFNRVPGENQMLELYDLYNDIGETTNMQASFPVERDTLIAMMDAWYSSGDVTGSYYPLMGSVIPPYLDPAPEGDILEVAAIQTHSLSNPNNDGIYLRHAAPDWVPAVQPYDGYVHAGDIFQYDIYVAEDSDQISGFYCSPSTGAKPRYNSTTRGIELDGMLLVEQTLPKGRWVRRLCGAGEIAPNSSYASFIALHNSEPGTYHFYIDNIVIRQNDGSIRGVTWSSGSDSSGVSYYKHGTRYKTLADVPDSAYSDISLNVADLSSLPVSTNAGSSYGAWAGSIGGLEGYDVVDLGPTNNWPLFMEYALGSDPTTATAGFLKGDYAPTSEEFGTYVVQKLPGENRDYMTLTFDFNRAARNVEIVVAESSNLVDWVDSVVLRPPYSDVGTLITNQQVVSVQDNLGGYPVDTTRVTARSRVALDEASKGFLKLKVRSLDATLPDAPSDLGGISHNEIVLEWSGSRDTDEYIIERALSGSGSFAEIARIHQPFNTDTTAVSGTTYDYRVRAVNAAGTSSWSGTVTITR